MKNLKLSFTEIEFLKTGSPADVKRVVLAERLVPTSTQEICQVLTRMTNELLEGETSEGNHN